MALHDTAAVIQRTVNARYTAFKEAMDRAIEVYGIGGNADQRRASLSPLAAAAENLLDVLAEQDRPGWLHAILHAARAFKSSPEPGQGRILLQAIIAQSCHISPINLVVEPLQEYDFDSFFARLREKRNLPDIFDRLAAELTRIIESGEVDSAVTLAALQRMIAALRANREGSQSSMEASFDYVRFGWNFLGEFLKRIPGVQGFATAVEKTIAEGDAELTAVREDMRDEAHAILVANVPNIKRISQYVEQVPLLTGNAETQNAIAEAEDAVFEVKAPPA
jgi:hypothetical protein